MYNKAKIKGNRALELSFLGLLLEQLIRYKLLIHELCSILLPGFYEFDALGDVPQIFTTLHAYCCLNSVAVSISIAALH